MVVFLVSLLRHMSVFVCGIWPKDLQVSEMNTVSFLFFFSHHCRRKEGGGEEKEMGNHAVVMSVCTS